MKIVIIDYDAGNVKSLQFALERLGIEAQITHDTELVSAADKVIFPGQGEASSVFCRPFAYAFIADKTVLNHNHEYKYDLQWA